MTRKIGDKLILEVQEPDECELCHKQAELRPYGPNGENICFECGGINRKATERRFDELINGKIQ